jgi:predicted branched-subunit amino acid permease
MNAKEWYIMKNNKAKYIVWPIFFSALFGVMIGTMSYGASQSEDVTEALSYLYNILFIPMLAGIFGS